MKISFYSNKAKTGKTPDVVDSDSTSYKILKFFSSMIQRSQEQSIIDDFVEFVGLNEGDITLSPQKQNIQPEQSPSTNISPSPKMNTHVIDSTNSELEKQDKNENELKVPKCFSDSIECSPENSISCLGNRFEYSSDEKLYSTSCEDSFYPKNSISVLSDLDTELNCDYLESDTDSASSHSTVVDLLANGNIKREADDDDRGFLDSGSSFGSVSRFQSMESLIIDSGFNSSTSEDRDDSFLKALEKSSHSDFSETKSSDFEYSNGFEKKTKPNNKCKLWSPERLKFDPKKIIFTTNIDKVKKTIELCMYEANKIYHGFYKINNGKENTKHTKAVSNFERENASDDDDKKVTKDVRQNLPRKKDERKFKSLSPRQSLKRSKLSRKNHVKENEANSSDSSGSVDILQDFNNNASPKKIRELIPSSSTRIADCLPEQNRGLVRLVVCALLGLFLMAVVTIAGVVFEMVKNALKREFNELKHHILEKRRKKYGQSTKKNTTVSLTSSIR